MENKAWKKKHINRTNLNNIVAARLIGLASFANITPAISVWHITPIIN